VDFIGDMSFAQSVMTILGGRPVRARLHCLPPMPAAGAHRRELAQAAHDAVAGALGVKSAAAA
jgi:1-acyl-sn-glycerol-3-phosphate acyltransferase